MPEQKEKNRFAVKIVRLTAIYAAIAFAVWFCILFYLNGTVVFADTTVSGSVPVSSDKSKVPADGNTRLTGVPADAQDIAFSHDGAYCTYMYNSQLFVREIATGKTKTITGNVSHPVLMADRNILLYFTADNGVVLNTYNIDSGQETRQASFAGEAGARVKAVDYSNQTNLVYVNLAQLKGNAETDAVYSVNIMKTIRKVPVSRVADNMVLLGALDTIYYNTTDGRLYGGSKQLADKGKVIGRDAQDRVYVLSWTDNRTVLIYKKKKRVDTVTLPEPGPIRFYTNQKGVYAVYGTHMINLAGDVNTKMQFESGLAFIGMGGENTYFRDTDGSIVFVKTTI